MNPSYTPNSTDTALSAAPSDVPEKPGESAALPDASASKAEPDAPKAEAGINKRQHERQHVGLEGAVAFEHAPEEVPLEGIPCEVFDISRSGVGIRSRKMMYAGRRVFVVIPTGEEGAPRILYGDIRYARYAERGLYHVGVKFMPVPTSHGIKDWLSEQSEPRKRRAA